MPSVQLYAGAQDPCCTMLEAGGVAYFMVAFAAGVESRNAESGGTRVVAQIYAIQEQGQRVLLSESTVASATVAHVFDSVRCVHVASRYLVVYFLDRDTTADTYGLEARYVDTQAFDSAISWVALDDITPDDAGLFDVKQVDNPTGTSEYMLTWASSTTECIVRRVISNDHTNIPTGITWSTTLTTNHADRILAVHGDGAVTANAGGAAIAYQDTDNDLIVHTLDYSDGTDNGVVTAVASTVAEYGAAGLCKTNSPASPTSARVAVVAERFTTLAPVVAPEDDYAHQVVCRQVSITATPAAMDNAHVTDNLNMMSKPYSYTDAEGTRHVYCGLGYCSVWFDNPYRQMNAFICDMGFQHWSAASSTVRPRPVATYPYQNIDTRNHGYCPETTSGIGSNIGRRMNHLSNFALGPSYLCDLRKARVVAWPAWGAVVSINAGDLDGDGTHDTRLEPTHAAVKAIWQLLEDAWTYNRDVTDYAQPSINFHSSNALSLYSNAEVQDELMIAGGAPQHYDGARLCEVGFAWTPEIVDVQTDAAGTNIPAGNYRYVAVYEWRDSRGQLHRSGHSNTHGYSAPGSDGATITVRCMNIGNRDAAWIYPTATPIMIALYRTTLANPNIFRRVYGTVQTGFTPQDMPVNDPTSWAVNITDNVSNVVLDSAAPLNFIDGGNAEQYTELPPMTPPAAHLVANYQNRAWLMASEERELWYSKENLATPATGRIAPEFHTALRYLLDVVDGEATGLHPLDDDLIIFTRDGIYALSGTGPDALGGSTGGATAQYSLQVLHKGTGCIEPRSIVEVPQGIMFQSYKGITLLDRGKELDFISAGSPVEDLVRTAGNVRAAAYLPDRWTVVFVANQNVTDTPLLLKWDFYHRMWSTAPLEPPNATAWLSSTAGGVAWRGNERDASMAVACQGGLLIERGKDDATPYQDENDAGGAEEICMDIETGWINVAGIAGIKRVREIGVQTEVVGTAQTMQFQIHYDDDGSYSLASPETKQLTSCPAYVRLRPRQQRMSAFRLRIVEPSGVAASENRKIVSFSIRIAVKKGLRKVAVAQQE